MRNDKGQFIKGSKPVAGFKKGNSPWNKGASQPEAVRIKISKTKQGVKNPRHSRWMKEHPILYWLGKKRPEVTDSKNAQWKGDEVGYRALHMWVVRKLGQPDSCINCGKNGLTGRKIHWSNISGKYLRDISDWQRLCTPCHKTYDMKRGLL